jgi:hypothetical protein
VYSTELISAKGLDKVTDYQSGTKLPHSKGFANPIATQIQRFSLVIILSTPVAFSSINSLTETFFKPAARIFFT